MKINKCSNCGRYPSHKEGVNFDVRENKLKIRNYKGNIYNLYLDLFIIPEIDDKKLEIFNKKYNKILHPDEETEFEFDKNKLMNSKIDNYPILCPRCRENLMRFTLEYGAQDKFVKF